MAWVVVFPFLAFRLIDAALRLTGSAWQTYLANLRPGVLCAGSVALAMAPFVYLQSPGILRLICSLTSASLVFGVWLYVSFLRNRQVLPGGATIVCS